MLSGAGGTAYSVFRPPVSIPGQDQRPGLPGAIPPDAETPAVGAAAKPPVQPAPETQKPKDSTGARTADGETLSEEEDRQVRDLRQTDAKVRAHEQAHAVAGGPYTAAPSYEFTAGPDGKRYATSGEVEIDSAPVRGDPEATIRKMDVVVRAALAPADPSSQDLAVARNAQAQRSQAQSELFKQRMAGRDDSTADDAAADSAGQTGALANSIAAAAYARTADSGATAQVEELIAAARARSIVA